LKEEDAVYAGMKEGSAGTMIKKETVKYYNDYNQKEIEEKAVIV
jgi:hypothetical protein